MLGVKNLIIVAAAGFIFSFIFSFLGGNAFFLTVRRSLAGSIMSVIVISAAVVVMNKIIPLAAPDMEDSITDKTGTSDIDTDEITLNYDNHNNTDTDSSIEEIIDNNISDKIDEDDKDENAFVEEVEEDSVGDIGMLDNIQSDEDIVEVMNDNDSIFNDELTAGFNKNNVLTNSKNDASSVFGDNIDAGTMAKAIKTFLNKDQKG